MNWLKGFASTPTFFIGLLILAALYMAYRLAESAIRRKGDVNVEMSRGKTVFKLEAKEPRGQSRDVRHELIQVPEEDVVSAARSGEFLRSQIAQQEVALKQAE